jgi:hypothetical protein
VIEDTYGLNGRREENWDVVNVAGEVGEGNSTGQRSVARVPCPEKRCIAVIYELVWQAKAHIT